MHIPVAGDVEKEGSPSSAGACGAPPFREGLQQMECRRACAGPDLRKLHGVSTLEFDKASQRCLYKFELMFAGLLETVPCG